MSGALDDDWVFSLNGGAALSGKGHQSLHADWFAPVALWHGGTLNRTGRPRRAIHAAFVRRHQRQQTVFSDYIHSATYERLSEAQRYLLGV